MREIKFRAQSYTGVWVYGYYMRRLGANNVIEHYICEPNKGQTVTRVFGKTVVQYTGLKDKNGKEIYCSNTFRIGKHNFTVPDNVLEVGQLIADGYDFANGEVTGNIYENKELLK